MNKRAVVPWQRAKSAVNIMCPHVLHVLLKSEWFFGRIPSLRAHKLDGKEPNLWCPTGTYMSDQVDRSGNDDKKEVSVGVYQVFVLLDTRVMHTHPDAKKIVIEQGKFYSC
jgi:hypothetical protein